MSSLDVKINLEGLPTGGFFNSLRNLFDKELRDAERDIKKRIEYSAKEEHNYNHQTRNLRNATKTKGALSSKNGLELYIDLNKAPYGEFIVTGQRNDPRSGVVKVKTGADPFIDNAIKTNETWIYQRIQQAVDGAVISFNRIR